MKLRPKRQRGATLFVVMILMFAMAWFAISAFRVGGQHLQIVGNDQARAQATAAAQRAIEQTISSNLFTKDPVAVAASPIATDIDGDGTPDFTATLTPAPKCIRVRPIKTMELDISLANDRVCLQSAGASGNLIVQTGTPVTSGNSLCANSEWDVTAAVQDPVTSTSLSVSQGVAIRVVATDAQNFCS